jgi:hypothetical protein
VSARLDSGKSPLDARKYQCGLLLKESFSSSGSLPSAPGAPGDPKGGQTGPSIGGLLSAPSVPGDPKLEAAAGTPFVPIVSGPISSSAPAKPVKGNLNLKPR